MIWLFQNCIFPWKEQEEAHQTIKADLNEQKTIDLTAKLCLKQ